MCVAQFSADAKFYRAEIEVLLAHSMLDVYYVDYGNRERVGAAGGPQDRGQVHGDPQTGETRTTAGEDGSRRVRPAAGDCCCRAQRLSRSESDLLCSRNVCRFLPPPQIPRCPLAMSPKQRYRLSGLKTSVFSGLDEGCARLVSHVAVNSKCSRPVLALRS